jgi:transmembrane sensor
MSQREQRAPELQRAWDSLESVRDDPAVQAWLREADRLGPRRPRNDWHRGRWAVAASFCLAVGAVAAYLVFSSSHYVTHVGEQRDIVLSDGSRITLNTNTALNVSYSRTRRYIELERGEALFSVQHNAKRPFDVAAGGTVTRALGTEFNVDLRASRVTVSVLEGAVQVAASNQVARQVETNSGAADEPRAGLTTIAAAVAKGEAVEIRPQERRVISEKADLKRIDAWRNRRLEFTDMPLPAAIEEFNRYSGTRVVIGTEELRSVRVSGVFRIGDTDGFVFSLKEALGMKTLDSPGQVTLLRGGSW